MSPARERSGQLDSPGVRVPPPLIYVAFLLLGYGVDRVAPLPYEPSAILLRVLDGVAIAGVLLLLWSMRQFTVHRTSVDPKKPSSALITTGPYRWSRNPIYLGFGLLSFGYSGSRLWSMLFAIVACLAVQHFVIRREEAYLERRFGDDYRAYKARVRRWL